MGGGGSRGRVEAGVDRVSRRSPLHPSGVTGKWAGRAGQAGPWWGDVCCVGPRLVPRGAGPPCLPRAPGRGSSGAAAALARGGCIGGEGRGAAALSLRHPPPSPLQQKRPRPGRRDGHRGGPRVADGPHVPPCRVRPSRHPPALPLSILRPPTTHAHQSTGRARSVWRDHGVVWAWHGPRIRACPAEPRPNRTHDTPAPARAATTPPRCPSGTARNRTRDTPRHARPRALNAGTEPSVSK